MHCLCNVGWRSYKQLILSVWMMLVCPCSECELWHQERHNTALQSENYDTLQTESQAFCLCMAPISKVDTCVLLSFIWWWRAAQGLLCAAAEPRNDEEKGWTTPLEGMRQVWSKRVDLTSTNLIAETITLLWYWKSRGEIGEDQLLHCSSLPGAEEICLLIWPSLFNISQQEDNNRSQIT